MNIDNTLYSGRPTDNRSEVEMAIYDKLDSLGIDYKRADHDHADTIEDCLAIERVLGAKICKNLFGCTFIMVYFYWVNSVYTVYFSFPVFPLFLRIYA